MDSGNSGSLQSSSGGDEEYDSRAADYAFMSPIPNAPPPQFIDPLSAYLQLHQNPNSLLLNSPNPLRSDPNPSHVAEFPAPAPLGSNTHHPQQAAAARNPKKRSRASRRAPTTVLTTDTANFRAMVQEFTGIPAPPFTTSSSFPRSRIDLFAPISAASVDSPPAAALPPPPPPKSLQHPKPKSKHSHIAPPIKPQISVSRRLQTPKRLSVRIWPSQSGLGNPPQPHPLRSQPQQRLQFWRENQQQREVAGERRRRYGGIVDLFIGVARHDYCGGGAMMVIIMS